MGFINVLSKPYLPELSPCRGGPAPISAILCPILRRKLVVMLWLLPLPRGHSRIVYNNVRWYAKSVLIQSQSHIYIDLKCLLMSSSTLGSVWYVSIPSTHRVPELFVQVFSDLAFFCAGAGRSAGRRRMSWNTVNIEFQATALTMINHWHWDVPSWSGRAFFHLNHPSASF